MKVIVCPKQKKVKFYDGKKLVKVYNFKEDIPFKIEKVKKTGYDHSAWSVSDRDFEYEVEEKIWDSKAIESIKQRAIRYHNQTP